MRWNFDGTLGRFYLWAMLFHIVIKSTSRAVDAIRLLLLLLLPTTHFWNSLLLIVSRLWSALCPHEFGFLEWHVVCSLWYVLVSLTLFWSGVEIVDSLFESSNISVNSVKRSKETKTKRNATLHNNSQPKQQQSQMIYLMAAKVHHTAPRCEFELGRDEWVGRIQTERFSAPRKYDK